MIEGSVHLDAGRRLRFREHEPADGLPVFVLHGTPGSRLVFESWIADAASKGIRLISYDRPGYGGSTPLRGRTVGDVARDVAAIANHLRLDRFGVWGMSGGGAPALACAALLPDRVVGASSLAGLAPYPAEGIDWIGDVGELNAEDFRLMVRDQPAWEEKSKKDREEMLTLTPTTLLQMFSSLLSEVDRAASTEEWASFLIRQMNEGLAHGDEGVRDDNLSLIKPWGFRPEDIRVPVQIWHGGQDRFVPFTHGMWLAKRISGVDAHLDRHQGHTSIVLKGVPEAQSWLKARF